LPFYVKKGDRWSIIQKKLIFLLQSVTTTLSDSICNGLVRTLPISIGICVVHKLRIGGVPDAGERQFHQSGTQ
jgi:hypothetical protein